MLEMPAKQWLSDLLGPSVRFDEPMAQHTFFKIGGPADALAEPNDSTQLKAMVQWAVAEKIPYLIIGGGTNLLVADGGIRGLVIRLGPMLSQVHHSIRQQEVRIAAGAGVPTKRLCALALRSGWQGMNFALGIPGTFGGALMMNAGTGLGCMADVIDAVTVMTSGGEQLSLSKGELNFNYRHLRLPAGLGPAAIILQGQVRLALGEQNQLRRQARQLMAERVRRQPIWQPSAGCIFKNPASHMPAGRLIDEAGLKGTAVGDALVSTQHANFIVNRGHATAADVLELTRRIQATVWQRFKIRLEPEVRVVGET